MRYLLIIICYLALLFCNSSCRSGSGFSNTPEISFISISKDTFNQGLLRDSIFVTIGFRDGDGDLGSKEINKNIILIDSRTNEEYAFFNIPEALADVQTGVEGEIMMKVYSECCLFANENIPPCSIVDDTPTNELTLDIKLIDDAGNESNTITSPILTIICD